MTWIDGLKYTSVFEDMSSAQWAFHTVYKLNDRPGFHIKPSQGEI